VVIEKQPPVQFLVAKFLLNFSEVHGVVLKRLSKSSCVTPSIITSYFDAVMCSFCVGVEVAAAVVWGRLAACAAVGYRRCPVQRSSWPIANRPQLAKLPHNGRAPRLPADTLGKAELKS
jgi:hypothetical protein